MIALDPSLSTCGVAWFDDARGTLAGAELVRASTVGMDVLDRVLKVVARVAKLDVARGDALVVEWPQVYPAGRGKGDPNDVVPLAAVCAAVAEKLECEAVKSYRPHEWKGTLSKEVCVARVQALLSPEERAVVRLPTARSLQHNVWDAIGLGLFHLGRFGKRRVIAR